MTRANDMDAYMLAARRSHSGIVTGALICWPIYRWQGALRRLIEEELTPFGHEETRRFSISGPDIILAPSIAQSRVLMLHELTTNAKYGALSMGLWVT